MPQWVCFDGLQLLVLCMAGCHPSPVPVPWLVSFGTREAADLRQNFPGPEEGSSLSPAVTNWHRQALSPHETGHGVALCSATFTFKGNTTVRG